MSAFERTPEQIEDFYSQSRSRQGVHASNTIGVGLGNQILGDVEYDPLRHTPFDVNHWSVMGRVEGVDYVQQVKRELPLNVNVVNDSTLRHELPTISAAKRNVAAFLTGELEGSISSITDKFFAVNVSERQISGYSVANDLVRVLGRDDFPAVADDESTNGLNFVISDFTGVKFEPGSLEGAIAIKVNHLVERRIPQNIGHLSLGGAVEINTGKKRQVDAYNKRLEMQHALTMQHLVEAGAKPVAVIADLRQKPYFVDVATADADIASAVEQLNDEL